MQAEGSGCELALELLEGAEVFVDCCGEFTFGATLAVGGHVLPEDGVVGVATEVERKVLLVQVDGGEVAGFARCFELLKGGVCATDVVCVVLVVMQFHDCAGDVWLECCVVVGELGERVDGHCVSFVRYLWQCYDCRSPFRGYRALVPFCYGNGGT
ncbi:Uncharacterised protein [Chlamydia trachomatis]|nr:Uncharacterised protein [Chlamydia trachomatis]